jgi:integrase
MFQLGHIPAHAGKVTTTTPLKDIEHVAAIKALLQDRPRDLALFVMGCNTAFRAGDLLALERSDLRLLPDGRYEVTVIEGKTRKLRQVTLNKPTSEVLHGHLSTSTGTYVFEGQRGRLSVSYLTRLLKEWAEAAGVEGRIASHTLRKTFVRLQHDIFGTSLTTLMHVLNHSSERQTLAYMGLLAEDVNEAYSNAI